MDAYEVFAMVAAAYTRDDYIGELFNRMQRDPKYRPVVKKLAAKGDAECRDVMVLWNEHVKDMRRLHAPAR